MPHYREISCKSALNRIDNRYLPYHWDLNIYRGCEHHCQYCYALYSHEYLEEDRFFDTIYIKRNVAERLALDLAKPSWKREVINLGGITDSYQPIEAKKQLMPDILRLLIQYRTPCTISTKSDLILRDFDLLDRLSRIADVNVATTITTLEEDLRQKLEPGGVPSTRRFEVLKAFEKTKVSTGVHMMPIVPRLTDSSENLNAIYAGGKAADVDYILPGLLNLKGRTRQNFLDFIHREFPQHMDYFLLLYSRGGLDKEYKQSFYKKLHRIKVRYGLPSGRKVLQAAPNSYDGQQLSLF